LIDFKSRSVDRPVDEIGSILGMSGKTGKRKEVQAQAAGARRRFWSTFVSNKPG